MECPSCEEWFNKAEIRIVDALAPDPGAYAGVCPECDMIVRVTF